MVDLNKTELQPGARDMLLKLWRGKFIILGALVLVTAASLLQYRFATPVYSATAIIMVKSPDKEKLMGGNGSGDQTSLETDVQLLSSYPLAEAAVAMLIDSGRYNSLKLFGGKLQQGKRSTPEGTAVSRPDADAMRGYAEALQGSIKAENVRSTNLIEVSAASTSAEEAALLANTVCNAYRQKDGDWNAAQDISVSRTIEQQIAQQEKKVADIENALAGFMKNRQVYEATGNVTDLQRSYTDAETQYNANRVQYDILRKQLAFIDQQLSQDERAFTRNVSQSITDQLRSMRDNIRSQENAYIALVFQKGMQDEGVKASLSQLNYVREQYEQIARKKIAGEIANSGNAQKYRFDLVASKMQTTVRLAELDNSAAEYMKLKNFYQTRLNQLPDKQITFAKLQLDHQVANKTYAFLKEKFDEARIKVASNAGRVVILKPALAPGSAEYPRLTQNLMIGLGCGLALGIGIVLGKDMLS